MAVLGLRFCARAFSSCGERGPLFIAVRGPLTIAASLLAEHRLQTRRLSNLWLAGRLALRHVGFSQTRARTHVPCIGRQILNHCATREAPGSDFLMNMEFPLGVMKIFCNHSGDGSQYCEYTKCHWKWHFKMLKMVNFMFLCILSQF